jgi:hypothetical protein
MTSISGFRSDVDEICPLLGYYAALSGNFYRRFGTTFRSHLQRQEAQEEKDFLILEDGTDALSRNVGKGLPHATA